MAVIRAWHSTSSTFDRFHPFSHFGSRAQAEMRATRGARLIEVELNLPKLKTMKDLGSWKLPQLRTLERKGFDGIHYLNRYEGIPLEAFERARAKYGDIDRLPDSRFRVALPEAGDSWIVFDPVRIRIVNVIAPTVPQTSM